MLKTILTFALLALSATISNAQTVVKSHTFAFTGPVPANALCDQITSWDGSDPAYPPYPGDMGAICLYSGDGAPTSPGSGLYTPYALGYLNNGDLAGCDSIVWGPKVWTVGDGTHTGDKYSISGSTTCPYYTGEYGPNSPSAHLLDGFQVTANYTITKRVSCRYSRCFTSYLATLLGGTGVAEETELP